MTTGLLLEHKIAISMDGRGAWRDNVFVEQLWRSVKYEEVYLHAYDTVADARASIGRYLGFYNSRRPHSSLDRKTPGSQTYPSPAAEANADGSTIVYFGPAQPAGVKRGNWIQTMPDKGWFTILRLYSPLEPFFTKEWRPSEIELVR